MDGGRGVVGKRGLLEGEPQLFELAEELDVGMNRVLLEVGLVGFEGGGDPPLTRKGLGGVLPEVKFS